MNGDDEVLVAWLKLRGYKIATVGGQMWLGQLDWANTRSVNAEDLSKWVSSIYTGRPLRVGLFAKQRGKRRPLRGLVREWVLGL